MVGDILLSIVNWILGILVNVLPTDVGNTFDTFQKMLANLAVNISSFFSFLSLYIHLEFLFSLILIMLLTPAIFLLVKYLITIKKAK